MIHSNHISTKWRPFPALFACLAATVLSFVPSFAASLLEPRYDTVLMAAMDQTFRMNYAAAESSLAQLPADHAAHPYFTGLSCLNRFKDLGDTAALRHAEIFWNRLSPRNASSERFREDSVSLRLYRGMAALQLSYIASLRGFTLRSASLALTARGQLLPVTGQAEADAGLALFDYYREHALEKIRFLPFVNPNTNVPLKQLKSAANQSRYLRDGLLVSAFWIHVDRKETDSALKIADDFLGRYPHNRLARQMRGSALFRGGRLTEARLVYEELLREYSALKDSLPSSYLPIGYYCSVANLARIYWGLGLSSQAKVKLEEWRKVRNSSLESWLPSSLKKDLEHLEVH